MEIGINKIREDLQKTKQHWAGLGPRHWGGLLQGFGFGALLGSIFWQVGIGADHGVHEAVFLAICAALIFIGQFVGTASDWRKKHLKLPDDAKKISILSTRDRRIQRGVLVEADAMGKTVVFDDDGKERGPSECLVVTDDSAANLVAQRGGYGVIASYVPQLRRAWEAWLVEESPSRKKGVVTQEEKWSLFSELVCDAVATLGELGKAGVMKRTSITDARPPS